MHAIRVLRKVKIDEKWELLPVTRDLLRVIKAGREIPATAGTFYLEYREDGSKRRRAVGTDPKAAQRALESQQSVLQLRARGVGTEDAPEIHARRPTTGKSLSDVAKAFRKDPPLGLRPRSIQKYNFDLDQFCAWSRARGKTHLSQIDRADIRAYTADLVRVEDLAMKSAINKSVIVLKILRDAGAAIEMKKGDWPKSTQVRPEPYTPEQLKPLFAAMLRDEFVLFQTFLVTGFRDQEMGFASWEHDFSAAACTMSVTKKSGHSFDPKTYKERTVEIPPEHVKLLLAHKERQEPGEFFMFPNRHGDRDSHMLEKLKRIAFHAGLNCGRCEGVYKGKPSTCLQKPICKRWTLHKFRHTYATTLIRDGWDVVTVQHMLGHAELESTLIYVHGLPSAERTRRMAQTPFTQFINLPQAVPPVRVLRHPRKRQRPRRSRLRRAA